MTTTETTTPAACRFTGCGHQVLPELDYCAGHIWAAPAPDADFEKTAEIEKMEEIEEAASFVSLHLDELDLDADATGDLWDFEVQDAYEEARIAVDAFVTALRDRIAPPDAE